MIIEEHERRIRLNPRFSANVYYLIVPRGDSTVIRGFKDLGMAVKVNWPNPPLKGTAGNYALMERMNERIAYRGIFEERVQKATGGRAISIPQHLLERAGLNCGDDVEVTGNSEAFYIRRRKAKK